VYVIVPKFDAAPTPAISVAVNAAPVLAAEVTRPLFATGANVAVVVTSAPFGSSNLNVGAIAIVTPVVIVPVVVTARVAVTAAPAADAVVEVVFTLGAVATTEYAWVIAVAFAGTTDKSPNPSEATATADTFFNEIVFTIFLSFSRFQAFPGLGWWSKRPPH
jgi:hypothetical protein